MSVLDVTALSPTQIDRAVKLFDEMCQKQLLPINEIDRDPTRKELDERFARAVLGLPEPILQAWRPARGSANEAGAGTVHSRRQVNA